MGKRPALRLFISSAPEDRDFLGALVKHLAGLTGTSLVSAWSVLDVAPGEVADDRIREEIERADLVLALVSSDYISNDLCVDGELRVARQRGVRIVPILVRPVELRGTDLGGVDTLPHGGPPVSQWQSQDAAWTDVLKYLHSEVADAVDDLSASPPQARPEFAVPTTEPAPVASVRGSSLSMQGGTRRARVNIRVAATFSGAGAVAGFTLEVHQATTFWFGFVFLVLVALLTAWMFKSLLAAIVRPAVTPASAAGKALGGAGIATGTVGGLGAGSGTAVVTLLSSAALATVTGAGGAELGAALNGHHALWVELADLAPDDEASASETITLELVDVAPDFPPPAPTQEVPTSSALPPGPTDLAPAPHSEEPPKRTVRRVPLRVARVTFTGRYPTAVLRDGPSFSGKKILSVPKDSEVKLLNQWRGDEERSTGWWCEVSFRGRVGWLHIRLLEGGMSESH
ncbi:MAG: TIR domain-containing protein [Polyangiaceae bacterium]